MAFGSSVEPTPPGDDTTEYTGFAFTIPAAGLLSHLAGSVDFRFVPGSPSLCPIGSCPLGCTNSSNFLFDVLVSPCVQATGPTVTSALYEPTPLSTAALIDESIFFTTPAGTGASYTTCAPVNPVPVPVVPGDRVTVRVSSLDVAPGVCVLLQPLGAGGIVSHLAFSAGLLFTREPGPI